MEALLVVLLGRRVAATLLGEHVDHDRALVVLGGVAERALEALEVVAVERAGVAHAERLEEHRRLEHLAEAGHRALEAPGEVVAEHGHLADHLLEARRCRRYAGLRRSRATLSVSFDTVGA